MPKAITPEVERYLETGESDIDLPVWPGSNIIEKMKAARRILNHCAPVTDPSPRRLRTGSVR